MMSGGRRFTASLVLTYLIITQDSPPRNAMRDDEYRAMYDLEERLWWYAGMRAVTASILDRELQNKSDLRLLDVGCGTGFSLVWLGERYRSRQAFGVDVSPHAADLWRLRDLDTVAV